MTAVRVAVERLVDSFPGAGKEPVRSHRRVVCAPYYHKKLECRQIGDGRVALFELLINTPNTGNLIREGKLISWAHVIQTGQQ